MSLYSCAVAELVMRDEIINDIWVRGDKLFLGAENSFSISTILLDASKGSLWAEN